MHLSEEEFNTLVEARKILTRICNESNLPFKLNFEVNQYGNGKIKVTEFVNDGANLLTRTLSVFEPIFILSEKDN